jgi:hypothetical protein
LRAYVCVCFVVVYVVAVCRLSTALHPLTAANTRSPHCTSHRRTHCLVWHDKSPQEDFKREVDYIEEVFTPLVEKCKSLNRAMRIGTNHGAYVLLLLRLSLSLLVGL